MKMRQLIDKLKANRVLSEDEFTELIEKASEEDREYLFSQSRELAGKY